MAKKAQSVTAGQTPDPAADPSVGFSADPSAGPATGPFTGDTSAHLVWDWNGTLLDDIEAVLGATNAAFTQLGIAEVTLEQYRDLYCVPIPRFYERLMGRLPTAEEWESMDGLFHSRYAELRAACSLTAGVELLLDEWAGAGRSQSVLSMYEHEALVPLVREHGIDKHFLRVEGRQGPSGGSKASHMVRHLAALETVDPARTVVIGDAADDAVAAHGAGARAVLYTGGAHSRSSLEETGAPVADSLAEAVREAERLLAG